MRSSTILLSATRSSAFRGTALYPPRRRQGKRSAIRQVEGLATASSWLMPPRDSARRCIFSVDFEDHFRVMVVDDAGDADRNDRGHYCIGTENRAREVHK
jgi:hypothetical protein